MNSNAAQLELGAPSVYVYILSSAVRNLTHHCITCPRNTMLSVKYAVQYFIVSYQPIVFMAVYLFVSLL